MSDLVIHTRCQAGQIRENPLTAEVIPTEAIPTLGNVPKWKIVPAARKNHMAIRTLRELQLIPVTKGTGSQRQKAVVADEDNLAEPWTCEDETQNTTKKNIPSCGKVRAVGQCLMVSFVKLYLDWSREGYGSIDLNPESIEGYQGLKAAFLAYFMQQKKYVKDPVEIHNIKQRDGETIEDFMEHFKVETGRIKGAPECMRISGFMHEVKQLPETNKTSQ
ncbi:hypothetical protein Tco_1547415 [Tanacetum coccineum]